MSSDMIVPIAILWVSSLVLVWYLSSRIAWAEGGRDVFRQEMKWWETAKDEINLVQENKQLQQTLAEMWESMNEYGTQYQEMLETRESALQTNADVLTLLNTLGIYVENGKVIHNQQVIAYKNKTTNMWEQPKPQKQQQQPNQPRYQ